VVSGPVSAEVEIRLSPTSCLIATITNSSAERMGLEAGTQVYALVKASSVLLADEGIGPVFSARNRLCGPIARIVDGPVSSEVTLDIGDGKLMTAVVTKASRVAMELEEGKGACALFKASSVILARP
jgi:molybdate transport system regulatory protein